MLMEIISICILQYLLSKRYRRKWRFFPCRFPVKRLETGTNAHQIMHQAVALGAFITAQKGACPEYTLDDFTKFRDQHLVSALPL